MLGGWWRRLWRQRDASCRQPWALPWTRERQRRSWRDGEPIGAGLWCRWWRWSRGRCLPCSSELHLAATHDGVWWRLRPATPWLRCAIFVLRRQWDCVHRLWPFLSGALRICKPNGCRQCCVFPGDPPRRDCTSSRARAYQHHRQRARDGICPCDGQCRRVFVCKHWAPDRRWRRCGHHRRQLKPHARALVDTHSHRQLGLQRVLPAHRP